MKNSTALEQREHPTSTSPCPEKWRLLHRDKSFVIHINKASRKPLTDSTKKLVTESLAHVTFLL